MKNVRLENVCSRPLQYKLRSVHWSVVYSMYAPNNVRLSNSNRWHADYQSHKFYRVPNRKHKRSPIVLISFRSLTPLRWIDQRIPICLDYGMACAPNETRIRLIYWWNVYPWHDTVAVDSARCYTRYYVYPFVSQTIQTKRKQIKRKEKNVEIHTNTHRAYSYLYGIKYPIIIQFTQPKSLYQFNNKIISTNYWGCLCCVACEESRIPSATDGRPLLRVKVDNVLCPVCRLFRQNERSNKNLCALTWSTYVCQRSIEILFICNRRGQIERVKITSTDSR